MRSTLSPEQKGTRKALIELSYRLQYSHLGSCLSSIDIIDAVYRVKADADRFVLSNGHSAIALYVVLAKRGILDESVIKKLHVHPDRNIAFGIHVSSGSLGQGLPIALGMAMADRNKRVFCLVSDGECAEGSIWESFRILYEHKVNNLVTIVNANGWGAYGRISLSALLKRIQGFNLHVIQVDGHDVGQVVSAVKETGRHYPSLIFARTTVEQFPFLKGQDAHYHVLNDEDYANAMKLLG
jgi:transketolase